MPALTLAVAGNLYLASLFVGALRSPHGNEDFIYGTGLAMFVIEFLSIHSTGVLTGARGALPRRVQMLGLRSRLGLLAFYGFLAVVLGAMVSEWAIILYFLIDLGAKLAGALAAPNALRFFVSFALFMVTMVMVVMVSPVLQRSTMFSLPPEVLKAKPPGMSGLFVDQPQNMLAWAIAYYGLAAALEVLLFLRRPDGIAEDETC